MMNTNTLTFALIFALLGCAADKHKRPDAALEGEPSTTNTDDPSEPQQTEATDAAVEPNEAADSAPADGAAPAADASGQPMRMDAAAEASTSDAQPAAAPDAGGTDAAEGGGDATLADADLADAELTREQFCSGRGGVIKLPGAAVGSSFDVCTGTIARQRFKNALCTCENTDFKGYLNTGSFSGTRDAENTFSKAGGSVGINGGLGLISAGDVDVGGSLRIYDGASFGGYVHVYGDLEMNEGATIAGLVRVLRDARFREDVILLGQAQIGRDVYTRPGKLDPPAWSQIGGERVVQELTLDKPCACEAKDLLDVDALIRAAHAKNDNAHPAVMLAPDALSDLSFAHRVELPCGRFYVDEITGIGDVRIVVNGRSALFVGGDVATLGRLDIELGPQGELDLFIGGNLTQVGYGTFGDVRRPAALRVYVGGSGDILYRGYQPFGANLYAPLSRLHADGFIDAKGAIFVRTLDVNGYLKVNYDRDILDQGDDESCKPPTPPPPPPPPVTPPPPPPQCTNSCDEFCGKQVCKSGMCAGCTQDSDCCEPLVCYPDGRCGPLLL